MKRDPSLRELGEDRLVAQLTRALPLGPSVVVGPGDDCAVLRPPGRGRHFQLLKTDVVVERVHFLPSTPPAAVGWKAAARAVSDMAAMGGWPVHAVVTVVAPGSTPASWVRAAYRGLTRCARAFDFSLVGGETSGAPEGAPVVLNVSLLGEVEPGRCLLRSGARPGDALLVTGRLGGSLASGRHLRFRPRVAEARWLAGRFRPTAMMDLSDGLGLDLPRLAAASGVGWELDLARLPRHRGCSLEQSLGDGEDFELLFSLPSSRCARLLKTWPTVFPGLALTQIGCVTAAGRQSPPLHLGFEHFRAAGAPVPTSRLNLKAGMKN